MAPRGTSAARRFGAVLAFLSVALLGGFGLGDLGGSVGDHGRALARGAGDAAGERSAPLATRPNIIVIETDDQPLITFGPRTMPDTYGRIASPGTVFSQMVATPPLCCPSRAAFLTGDYPHNSGVWNNNTAAYGSLKQKHNVLSVWLHRAGYRTALIGKFLNGYGREGGDAPPPGWQHALRPLNPYAYYGTPFVRDGHRLTLRKDVYITDAENFDAVHYLQANLPSKRPVFMWYTPTAPHSGTPPTVPCDQHQDPIAKPSGYRRFADFPFKKSPSYNEADVSDKPPILQRPPLTPQQEAWILGRYHCALGSLWTVDQGVGEIVDALRSAGELRNTLLIFTSDNGMLYGEHRLPNGKEKPYEESMRVPLAIRAPAQGGATQPSISDAPVGMIDLAPTILDYAGAAPCTRAGCRTIDGMSLRPLLEGRSAKWSTDRGLLVELSADCAYEGIRTPSASYVEYRTAPGGNCPGPGVAELYDLSRDPFELTNLADPPGPGVTPLQSSLQERLYRLETCSGTKPAPGVVPCE